MLFAVGTNVQAGWVLTIAALLLGVLVVGMLLPLSALRGIEISRHVPRTADAGRPVSVTIAVTNTSRSLRGMFRIADHFCGDGWAFVGAVGPGQEREFVAERHDARRGVHADGPCSVETGAPFGVMRVRREARLSSPIVVYPKTYAVPDRSLAGPLGWPAPSATGDVSSVRDYRPGDPLRHIHWRSVAKRGRLVVREFDRERQVDAAVIAHLHDDPAGDPNVGDAVATVAASFALALVRAGEVQLVSADAGHVSSTGTRSSERVLDWGARLLPGDASLSSLIARVAASASVVCVCAGRDVDVATLARLAGNTSVLAVLVDDHPGDSSPTRAPATSRNASQLRASGVRVAVVDPSALDGWFANGCEAS